MKLLRLTVLIVALISLTRCPFGSSTGEQNPSAFLALVGLGSGSSAKSRSLLCSPEEFPTFVVPADNPMSAEKVTLGRHLFYDKRLSGDQTQACATCHIQRLAFSDGRQTGRGSGAHESHPRSPQHLVNVAYEGRYTWANDTVTVLEEQAKAPLYGTGPVELGLTLPSNPDAAGGVASGGTESIPRLQAAVDVDYKSMFAAAFGGAADGSQITDRNIRKAIASFERTMISTDSYYEKAACQNDPSILTAAGLNAEYVNAGASIFNDERGDCFHCHGGFNYADMMNHSGTSAVEVSYHNNGIHTDAYYNSFTSPYAYIPSNAYKGLYNLYPVAAKLGLFRAPTLRNVGVTHPFMHDGSFYCAGYSQPPGSNTPPAQSGDLECAREALKAVVLNYAKGGVSPQPANQDLSQPSGLSILSDTTEQNQLVEFLLALTDPGFLTRSSLSDPQPSNPNFQHDP